VYLSSIPVETGNDPTRIWPGKKWIRNPYRVHQRLCMAFDGSQEPRFLFRIEGPVQTRYGLRPRILVQSHTRPAWDAAFHNAPFLIAGRDLSTIKVMDLRDKRYGKGLVLRFRLHANPSVKKKRDGQKNGLRKGIKTPDEQQAWLERKAAKGGFRVLRLDLQREGYQVSRRSREIDPNAHVHLGVTFEGVLQILDEEEFQKVLVKGIGPAKAYGFGLLSVARAGP
jgi:CRISPR system Cascade subunit CasE